MLINTLADGMRQIVSNELKRPQKTKTQSMAVAGLLRLIRTENSMLPTLNHRILDVF